MSKTVMTSREVRDEMVRRLRLDLVGPGRGDSERARETLNIFPTPHNWYLTGFLIPDGTPPEAASAETEDEGMEVIDGGGLGEESSEERRAARRSFFPSSIGLSFLMKPESETLSVDVHWGDYSVERILRSERAQAADPAVEQADRVSEPTATLEAPVTDENATSTGETEDSTDEEIELWRRTPRHERITLSLSAMGEAPLTVEVPNSDGLQLVIHRRLISDGSFSDRIPDGSSSVSLFLVNRREVIPSGQGSPDPSYCFQPELVIDSGDGILARPDLRSLGEMDPDDEIADLHYADSPEYGVGHGISVEWTENDEGLEELRTAWMPTARVCKVDTSQLENVELSMDTLGQLADDAEVHEKLDPLVAGYRQWLDEQEEYAQTLERDPHREMAVELVRQARVAAARMERGIAHLAADADALDAFRMANRSVSRALKKRLDLDDPQWRPFQLAFLLINLSGMIDATDPDRELVDLLFFPTGGGKTEAYLGLAAFAMVLRRLRNPGLQGAGVSVLMRYTLRLLTLDQLGRAAGLVCALELEREEDPDRYGEWPFEIGLWVGKAATPNRLGFKGDKRNDTARSQIQRMRSHPERHSAPIPLESCPWCGEAFTVDSFELLPNNDHPKDLKISCSDFACEFSGSSGRLLPIVAVDEVLYRRLPSFLIGTVDKFASLPWTGPSGVLLGGADRQDSEGFYGPANSGRGRRLEAPLPPLDLVIQDELHLISGPLGTMAGLYESVIDALGEREVDGQRIRPKVVASTATARRAREQVQAIFGRPDTRLFPPPGPRRADTYFAHTTDPEVKAPRIYQGLAVQGRSPREALRKAWVSLMSAAQDLYMLNGGYKSENPADPYMTTLGYFSSLRELGGCRRVLEEEVQNYLKSYGRRNAPDQERIFRDRKSWNEVVELTSRVSTGDVAKAKQRLETDFTHKKERVDAALATNMISVGLDIPRLGLMVVNGQPKSHSEYIQATSRVGRDDRRPGLILTLMNIYRARDRSHYERFRHYHETFYRAVEGATATPFSPRALDRGFAGALVGLVRQHFPHFSTPAGAEQLPTHRSAVENLCREVFTQRLESQGYDAVELKDRKHSLHQRIGDLLDSWLQVLDYHQQDGESVHYDIYEERKSGTKPLLQDPLDTNLEDRPHHRKYRVHRSLRDVEPSVRLFLTDRV